MSETAQKRLRDDEREALMAAFHARDHAGSYVLPPHCHGCVEFVYDFEPLVCELIAARLIGFTAELSDAIRAGALAPVLALAEDVWRVAPCGCGHRADLHTNPVYPDEVAICRGHALCGCDWSFVRIVQHRLRAALHPDTMPGGPVVSEQHTSEGDAPVVWHDEAQRFHDLGILDPPTFCACDDCLRAPAAALRAAAGTPAHDTTEEDA